MWWTVGCGGLWALVDCGLWWTVGSGGLWAVVGYGQCSRRKTSIDSETNTCLVYTSVPQSGPYRPPGGVEEMQGGGRRVRLEWGAYITV
ncbi:hypothetical protein FHG87_012046 [Trinorchestia longiramus]|nr:hypothetical protein FHG87_012046 [Trinorchestia longiramus]